MRRTTRVQIPASLFAIGCLAFSKGVLCVASRRERGRVAVGGAPSEHSAHSLVEVGAEPPPAPAAALQPVVADAVAALRAGTTAVVCSPCALGAAACEGASRAVAAAPLHAVGCARGLRCGTGPRGERMTDCRHPPQCLLRSARHSSISTSTRSAMPALRSLRRHWRSTAR